METITKEELNQVILHGIAADIFVAERAYSLFRAIGNESAIINEKGNSSHFFSAAQSAFKDQFLIAIARLFDKPSQRNKTACIKGVLSFIQLNGHKLPPIIEHYNLQLIMETAAFPQSIIANVNAGSSDLEITRGIVHHFEDLLHSDKIQRFVTTLKEIRDKKLAHNEIVRIEEVKLIETIDAVTFKDLYSLLDICKNPVGVIGWAYLSTIFMHNGTYILTDDALRPQRSFNRLIERFKN